MSPGMMKAPPGLDVNEKKVLTGNCFGWGVAAIKKVGSPIGAMVPPMDVVFQIVQVRVWGAEVTLKLAVPMTYGPKGGVNVAAGIVNDVWGVIVLVYPGELLLLAVKPKF